MDQGPPDHGPCASDHGPLVLALWIHWGTVLFGGRIGCVRYSKPFEYPLWKSLGLIFQTLPYLSLSQGMCQKQT